MISKLPFNRLLWLLPVLLALAFNFNVLSNGFGWDDEPTIQALKSVEHGWNIFLPAPDRPFFLKSSVYYYRPVISISYLLDLKIWGAKPFGFHLSVLIFHVINTGLVFLLAQSLTLPPRGGGNGGGGDSPDSGRNALRPYNFIPLIAASLFAVHPIHAEAVAWIAGRADVFCTTFILTSLILYIRYHRKRALWLYVLSMLAFALGLLTKEAASGAVFLFPAYEILTRNGHDPDHPGSSAKRWIRMSLRSLPPLMIFGLYVGVRSLKTITPWEGKSAASALSSEGVLDLVPATGLYLKMMLWPFPHSPFISAVPDSGIFTLMSGLILLLAGSVFVHALIRRNLGATLAARNKFEAAEGAYRRALQLLEESLGTHHPHTIQVLKNYAGLLRKTHREEEAERLEARFSRMME